MYQCIILNFDIVQYCQNRCCVLYAATTSSLIPSYPQNYISCSGQSLVSPGVDQPRPRPPVEADIGVDSEGGTVGRQVRCLPGDLIVYYLWS